ncbi:hypothetical protein HOT75_gp063 [Gordonia phage Daredevil]|uniref:Holliday junction resolvase n=1 Tax=Gordonia phage Daredevil TaxID=2283286 RepID=A0A345MIR9_9CAUD|nr:hypothetical protein HOT75_gp063 [Gordonia phage Daredevil]AXH70450.1 hypothetical protein SEA_DAREDEVIL_63 [Gordonia phage Daredevil]
MANRNKAKGDKYERDVLAAAIEAGFAGAKRTRPGRMEDQGDIHLFRETGHLGALGGQHILQTKDVATPQWREWLDQLELQSERAAADTAALVVKRRGSGGRPPVHLAVMSLDEYLRLIYRFSALEEDRH